MKKELSEEVDLGNIFGKFGVIWNISCHLNKYSNSLKDKDIMKCYNYPYSYEN